MKIKIMDYLYPRRCPICGKIPAKKGESICPTCREQIIVIKEPRCKKCGKQLQGDYIEYCYDCSRKQFAYDQGAAIWEYNQVARQSVSAFKYHNKREYGAVYAAEMARQLSRLIQFWQVEVILPVPLHKKRKAIRGYNQAEILARQLSSLIGIPVDTGLITRVRNTLPQKNIADKMVRQNNLKNAFKITEDIVKYNAVLLIDDIYTSGSTIHHLAGLLKENGCKRVYYISICIGSGY